MAEYLFIYLFILLPKQVDCEFKDKRDSRLWRQTSTSSVTWLCLSNPKDESTCSHSFLHAAFAGSVCCSHFGVNHLMGAHNATTAENPDAGSKSFLLKFHLWNSRELEFALCYLQNTSLFNHALECDHMRSPFWFDKQSHVTKIVDVWSQSQPPQLSLNSRSTCFGSIIKDSSL